jgi:hypothetical protein
MKMTRVVTGCDGPNDRDVFVELSGRVSTMSKMAQEEINNPDSQRIEL